jgi:hypothetical protein
MSDRKHTPGPWYLVKTAVYDAKNLLVTDTCFTGGSPRINEANARLIAAAPDLADSAVGFLNWFQGFVGAAGYAEINCKELTDLQAALAKAGVQ